MYPNIYGGASKTPPPNLNTDEGALGIFDQWTIGELRDYIQDNSGVRPHISTDHQKLLKEAEKLAREVEQKLMVRSPTNSNAPQQPRPAASPRSHFVDPYGTVLPSAPPATHAAQNQYNQGPPAGYPSYNNPQMNSPTAYNNKNNDGNSGGGIFGFFGRRKSSDSGMTALPSAGSSTGGWTPSITRAGIGQNSGGSGDYIQARSLPPSTVTTTAAAPTGGTNGDRGVKFQDPIAQSPLLMQQQPTLPSSFQQFQQPRQGQVVSSTNAGGNEAQRVITVGGPPPASPFTQQAEAGRPGSIGRISTDSASSGGRNMSYDSQRNRSFEGRPSHRSSGSHGSEMAQWECDWGDIDLIKRIGQGSFGQVYLARWRETKVAVKVLFRDESSTGPAGLDKVAWSNPMLTELLEEASIMVLLRHENIISFMAVSSSPKAAIITEYCANGSLTDVLKAARRDKEFAKNLSWARRLKMMKDATRGVYFLHTCKPSIVHRDLKSPNLLVDEHWKVKVADFNLSRIAEKSGNGSTMSAMNPNWLAPEVLQGDACSQAGDIFSLAVVMWELMTWEAPWFKKNPYLVSGAVIRGERLTVPECSALPGGTFPGMPKYVALMKKCWDQNPAQRPSAKTMLAELREIEKLL